MVAVLQQEEPTVKVSLPRGTSLTLTLGEWVSAHFDLIEVPEFLSAVREEHVKRGNLS